MIDKIEDKKDTWDMALAITETPRWLSKVQVGLYILMHTKYAPLSVNKTCVQFYQSKTNFQAGCAAQKLFATLEKERADYFKTITDEELDKIPTFLLLHLP